MISENKKLTLREVVAEGALAIIGGSDTVATALTSLVFLLLTHPAALKRVQEEIDDVFPPGSVTLEPRMLSRLIFLEACL